MGLVNSAKTLRRRWVGLAPALGVMLLLASLLASHLLLLSRTRRQEMRAAADGRLITSDAQIFTPDIDRPIEIRASAALAVRLPHMPAPKPGETYAAGKLVTLNVTQASAMAAVTVRGFTSPIVAWSIPLVGGDQALTTTGTRRYGRTTAGWVLVE